MPRPAFRFVAVFLVLALLHPLAAQTAPPQRIRQSVQKLAIGDKMTVDTLDGRELHGNLSAIDADSFALREVDLQTLITLRYDEVRAVSKNYGRKGFAGRRVSPRRSRIAGFALLGGLVVLIAVVALAKD